ncbi:hypothetical protein HYX70_01765 [Candidatus Saccharibacteria bacterium]|nr:hypothetical protein [Candidatus Saccharibacteria bacterium]
MAAAAGGSIVFQTSPASGVSSSTANTLTTYFTLNSAGVLTGSNSATISVPGTNATNENWGSGASASSSNTLAVGNGASVASGGLSDRTTAIGRLATGVANAQNIVLFGYNAVDTGAADNNVIFGANAKTTGSNSVVFGPSTNASAGSVIIGQGSTSTNTNVIVFGGGQSGVASTTMLIGTW